MARTSLAVNTSRIACVSTAGRSSPSDLRRLLCSISIESTCTPSLPSSPRRSRSLRRHRIRGRSAFRPTSSSTRIAAIVTNGSSFRTPRQARAHQGAALVLPGRFCSTRASSTSPSASVRSKRPARWSSHSSDRHAAYIDARSLRRHRLSRARAQHSRISGCGLDATDQLHRPHDLCGDAVRPA